MTITKRNYTKPALNAFIALLFLSSGFTFGQTNDRKYVFIKETANRISFADDSSSFAEFYRKLDRVKAGENRRLNVVHIGGSHVQAGIWSTTFLSNFQAEYGTAGGGYFVFPYKMAKTNGQPYATSFTNGKWKRCRPVGKEFCQPLGMCAMNITTNDSANFFGARLTQKASCKFVNTVKVYHNFNESFHFEPCRNDSFSVTRVNFREQGYSLFRFQMPVDSVNFELVKKDTAQKDFIIYGFSFENDLSPGFYLAALGANGASSSSFLRCENLLGQLQTLNGDLFVISLGVNDTQSKGFEKDDYIENYDSLITIIKRSNPGCAILLTTTTDNFIRRRTSNKRTITARDAMFELMQKHKIAVWDLFTIMGGYKSMANWYKAGLAARDKVHFTTRGYTLVGNLMYEAVKGSYQKGAK